MVVVPFTEAYFVQFPEAHFWPLRLLPSPRNLFYKSRVVNALFGLVEPPRTYGGGGRALQDSIFGF